jgi:hypothetical protein
MTSAGSLRRHLKRSRSLADSIGAKLTTSVNTQVPNDKNPSSLAREVPTHGWLLLGNVDDEGFRKGSEDIDIRRTKSARTGQLTTFESVVVKTEAPVSSGKEECTRSSLQRIRPRRRCVDRRRGAGGRYGGRQAMRLPGAAVPGRTLDRGAHPQAPVSAGQYPLLDDGEAAFLVRAGFGSRLR